MMKIFVATSFTASSVELYIPQLIVRSESLITEISSSSRKQPTQDISEWFSRFSFDFMGDLAFGGGFELTKNGDTEGYFKLLEGANLGASTLGQATEIGLSILPLTFSSTEFLSPLVAPLIFALPNPGAAKVQKYVDFCNERIQMRQRNGPTNNNKDVFYYLLGEGEESQKQHTQSDRAELTAESMLVVAAVCLNYSSDGSPI
jgi:hypothetical protein